MILANTSFPQLTILIEQIRLFADENEHEFNTRLTPLLSQYSVTDSFKKELTEFCFLTLDNALFVNAFSDYGINSNRGFFTEISKRLKHKILPVNNHENEFSHFITFIFNKQSDYEWLEKINFHNWKMLTNLLDNTKLSSHSTKILQQVLDALLILGHRLTTIGIDPYITHKLPLISTTDDSFLELNHALSLFVKKYTTEKTIEIDHAEIDNLMHLIGRSEEIFTALQERKDTIGTSLHLTFLLKRAQQHFDRIRLLLTLINSKQYSTKFPTISNTITALVKAEHTKNSVRGFIRENTRLLAYRIVSHTSEKGEHYIGFSRK